MIFKSIFYGHKINISFLLIRILFNSSFPGCTPQPVGTACRNQLALTCFMFREMQAKKLDGGANGENLCAVPVDSTELKSIAAIWAVPMELRPWGARTTD